MLIRKYLIGKKAIILYKWIYSAAIKCRELLNVDQGRMNSFFWKIRSGKWSKSRFVCSYIPILPEIEQSTDFTSLSFAKCFYTWKLENHRCFLLFTCAISCGQIWMSEWESKKHVLQHSHNSFMQRRSVLQSLGSRLLCLGDIWVIFRLYND